MGYIKRLCLKTGKTYNPASLFNINSLTPSQKLELAACRIWGTQINTGHHTGLREWRKPERKPIRKNELNFPFNQEKLIFPYYQKEENDQKKNKYENKKMRVLLKGIKIGKKKGGLKIKLSDIFEKKDQEN